MFSRFFVILILSVFAGLNVFSQTTNTRKWRKTENDSMQQALLLYDENNFLMALPIYENLYNSHPKEEYLKYCYGKCALERSDKHEDALRLLSEVYLKNKKIEDIEYDLARANHYNYKFDEALALLEIALANKKVMPEAKEKAKILKQYCINAKEFYAKPTNAVIANAGNVLNTKFHEYVPVISADETVMIFTYVGEKSLGGLQNAFQQQDPRGAYFEDVYQSYKENDQWTLPTPIKSVNTTAHDAAIALSVDGQTLFTYRDDGDDHGDIYMSTFDTAWSAPKKLQGQVNSYSWEGSCSMTPDGRYLYFSSERGGGYGGRDIYRATLQADSTWGNVVNLGDSINTALDDDAPFIHPDGITLFYSSKGKNSMGDYDIFQAKLNWVDSTFHNAVNMGYPINTPDNDRYYVLSANGETGYYASGKKGGEGLQDIYSVTPGYVGKKPSVMLVKGRITADGNPIAADIIVEITNKENKVLGHFKSNTVNGNYLVSLPAGGEFKLVYKYKNFPYKTLDVNTNDLNGYEEKLFDMNFESRPAEMTVKGKTTVNGNPVITMIDIELFGDSIEKKNFGHFKSDSLNGTYSVKLPAGAKYNLVYKHKKYPYKTLDVNALNLQADEEKLFDIEFVEPLAVKKPVVVEKPVVAKKDTTVSKKDFKPINITQQKVVNYSELYGDISAEGLTFRVQVAAYKYPKNYRYKHLDGLGAVEQLKLDDNITRITIGGDFKTLNTAFIHNIKVVMAGQKDAFVTAIYKGKRVYLEDLERMGIFPKKG